MGVCGLFFWCIDLKLNNFLEFCLVGIERLENDDDFCSLFSGLENEDDFLCFFFIEEVGEVVVNDIDFDDVDDNEDIDFILIGF